MPEVEGYAPTEGEVMPEQQARYKELSGKLLDSKLSADEQAEFTELQRLVDARTERNKRAVRR